LGVSDVLVDAIVSSFLTSREPSEMEGVVWYGARLKPELLGVVDLPAGTLWENRVRPSFSRIVSVHSTMGYIDSAKQGPQAAEAVVARFSRLVVFPGQKALL
jgi:hypothetical protein